MLSSKKTRLSFSNIETLESRTLFSSFLSHLTPTPTVKANTVPGTGDQNPYGVAFVANNEAGGKLIAGDVLVSNFNNSNNTQGTGTTIVEINPNTGAQTVFFQGPAGIGLTTALGVLPGGFVVVGNTPDNAQGGAGPAGSLLVINRNGKLVKNLTDPNLLDGPWDLTVVNHGFIQTVFVAGGLNGTVSRLDFFVNPFGSDGDDVILLDKTQVASGYQHSIQSVAFLLGPTGLAFDRATDTLYVASTQDNAIFAVHNAQFAFNQSGTGTNIFSDSHLRGPLGLAFAPNGDLLAANGDAINPDPAGVQNSEIVEFTKTGTFIGEFQIDPAADGAFGIAVETRGDDTFFAAVNDNTNQLDIWKFESE